MRSPLVAGVACHVRARCCLCLEEYSAGGAGYLCSSTLGSMDDTTPTPIEQMVMFEREVRALSGYHVSDKDVSGMSQDIEYAIDRTKGLDDVTAAFEHTIVTGDGPPLLYRVLRATLGKQRYLGKVDERIYALIGRFSTDTVFVHRTVGQRSVRYDCIFGADYGSSLLYLVRLDVVGKAVASIATRYRELEVEWDQAERRTP